MVILAQYKALIATQFFQDRVGEFFIHPLVSFPVALPKNRAHMGDVAEGPQAFIGISIVERVLFLLRQPDPPQCKKRVFRRDLNVIHRIDNIPVGIPRTVADPRAARPLRDRVEAGHPAAGGLRQAAGL